MKRTGTDAKMAVTCDEPGVRFFLDRSGGFPLGHIFVAFTFLIMGGMFLAPWAMLYVVLRDHPKAIGEAPLFAQLFVALFVGLWCLGTSTALVGGFRSLRLLHQLHVDGVTNELRVVEKGFFGLTGRRLKLPTAQLVKLEVCVVPPGGRDFTFPMDMNDLGLSVRVSWWSGKGRKPAGATTFCVAGLDKREEVLDLALRLGAAAGFGSYRIVRSDLREIDVEMDRRTAGDQPMPALAPADYARDHVAAEARAGVAEEKVPPFDPESFKSPYRVREWRPGEYVRLHKPFTWGVLGCLPIVMLPSAGFVALVSGMGTVHGSRAALVAFLGIFSLVFLFVFVALLVSGWPRRVTLDWRTRKIAISREPALAMSAVRAVELRGVKIHYSGGKNSSPYWTYHCEIDLHHAKAESGEATVTRLAETERERDDPATPWRHAMPLAADLARALGVERRVTDYQQQNAGLSR